MTRLPILLFAALLCGPALSEELELGAPMSLDEARHGTLLLRTEVPGLFLPAPTLQTDVVIQVTGLVARAAVEQRFHNPTDEWVEGVYVFPLPESAAVDQLRMTVGERVVEGEIHEREEARKIYEQAKREGRKTSLVEQERPNVFTTSVANIGPGESIVVVIEYQEELSYDNGRFSLRFPMVVAPRYVPGTAEVQGFAGTGWAVNTDQVPDAERVTPPVAGPSDAGAPTNPVRLELVLDPGLPLGRLESPSHEIEVVEEAGRYAVAFRKDAVPADRDFLLEWEPQPGTAPQAALFTQEADGGRYVLLMVLPPHGSSAASVRLPRETTFVLDTSGSMNGASIRQAREALVLALDRLRPEDRFNVVRFSGSAEQLFPASVDATPSFVEEAKRWVRGLQAKGGTEILRALEVALAGEPLAGEPLEGKGGPGVSQVIFLTDGSVGNEDAILSFLAKNLGKSRLFTVGIGSAPNSYFMKKAAEIGRGTFTYVSDVHQVAEKMGELFRKLESPVLTDIEVVWDDPTAETWPERPGDLYLGEPVQVAALLPNGGNEVRVTGWRDGSPWEMSFPITGGDASSGIDKLWARRKIEALMDSRRSISDAEAVRGEVVEVALRHHLVSRYTSLVAVDPIRTAPEGTVPRSRPLPVALPAGWTGQRPGLQSSAVRLPQGSTPAALKMIAGVLLLLLTIPLRLLRRRFL